MQICFVFAILNTSALFKKKQKKVKSRGSLSFDRQWVVGLLLTCRLVHEVGGCFCAECQLWDKSAAASRFALAMRRGRLVTHWQRDVSIFVEGQAAIDFLLFSAIGKSPWAVQPSVDHFLHFSVHFLIDPSGSCGWDSGGQTALQVADELLRRHFHAVRIFKNRPVTVPLAAH